MPATGGANHRVDVHQTFADRPRKDMTPATRSRISLGVAMSGAASSAIFKENAPAVDRREVV
jgi:hypothetical protein